MTTISITERPADQREDYLFIQSGEHRFKALHELRHNDADQPLLAISIAPVDSEGKALKLASGAADVTYHAHVFTEFELSDPDFNMDKRVGVILTGLVERKIAEVTARSTLAEIGIAWKTGSLSIGQ